MKYTLFLSCIRGFENNCKKDIEKLGIKEIKTQANSGQLNYNLGKFFHQINMTVLKRSFKKVS